MQCGVGDLAEKDSKYQNGRVELQYIHITVQE
jgi:hypothetical protein